MLGLLNPPTLVTMAGLLCALTACWLALTGHAELALVALIWAGLCDLFDGLVARRCKLDDYARRFGVQIDSLVDMVSFGVAPVMIAAAFGLSGLGMIAGGLYICAAAQRLAHFNVTTAQSASSPRFYTGLPVTFAALILPLVLAPLPLISGDYYGLVLTVSLLLMAWLFVAPLRIRKPSGLVYWIMPLLAIVLSVYWVAIALNDGVARG